MTKRSLFYAGFGLLIFGITSVLASGRAEACSRSFFIFFDEGSTEISGRGNQVAESFIRYFRDQRPPTEGERALSCGPLPVGNYKVVVVAHANDLGTQDQCALSFARGYAVRTRLTEMGLAETSIVVAASGDRSRMVPGPSGTSDPQNRRVELDFDNRVMTSEQAEVEKLYPWVRDRLNGLCPTKDSP